MTRVKSSESRKDELLEAATNLFLQQGYHDTSVNSIVKAIGVSKGTFYYYFDSKEDVLDGLVDKMGAPIYREIDKIIADNSLTAIEKLNRIFATSRKQKIGKMKDLRKIIRLIYRPENLRLLDKIQKDTISRTVPKVAKVVEQGIEEGTLNTRFPEEASYLVFWMASGLQEQTAKMLLDAEIEVDADELLQKYRAYENAVERVLGAPEDSIDILGEKDLRKFVSHLNKGDK